VKKSLLTGTKAGAKSLVPDTAKRSAAEENKGRNAPERRETPPEPAVRQRAMRLDSLRMIKRHIGRVLARLESCPADHAVIARYRTMIYGLSTAADVLKASELEGRLAELERELIRLRAEEEAGGAGLSVVR
jgi:hypothetical protein